MKLSKGQKIDITKGRTINRLTLSFGWEVRQADVSVDASVFLLSKDNRCMRDEDLIFYGNPHSSDGTVVYAQDGSGKHGTLKVALSSLPERIDRLAVTVSIYESVKRGHTMNDVTSLYVKLMDDASGEVIASYECGADVNNETAIVVGELYRYQGEWKFSAIGSGFYGGLEALVTHYGLELEQSEGMAEVAAAVEEVVEQKPIPVVEETPIRSTIDLRKKTVEIVLKKKQLTDVVARVGVVLDISGSMQQQYRSGIVQDVVERVLAIACQFDDNATLDVWIYDNEFSRMPSVTEHSLQGYVTKQILDNPFVHKFGRNNEPPVMEDIIRKYTVEEDSDTPVYIIFINDGGVQRSIQKVITRSAVLPIFWQFVGIGDSSFEVLKKLDTMQGRIVDNANFIHWDRIEHVSDEELYDKLLNEFPQWIREAKQKRILR
ncbi:stress response protein SCP2 [Paenibacillus cellulosilyticus]|uniref:Stress response protein SCP2 n=1 Tax=Paenibacillus cellulosilyticus TaxID=375489 RepID=A0A2V2YQH3_9BACL|nr:stress response protein SCP2 [Paenibacillus cellulosilyticus]QKS45136.1 VWA domain-containing protein [Paenibacillus cellulosilyticus]